MLLCMSLLLESSIKLHNVDNSIQPSTTNEMLQRVCDEHESPLASTLCDMELIGC